MNSSTRQAAIRIATPQLPRFVQVILLGLGLFFAGWLLLTTYRYTIDIPIEDDFSLYWDRWMLIDAASSWGEKLEILHRQNGLTEHRMTLGILLAKGMHLLTGRMNFSAMTWIGVLSLVWLLWEYIRLAVRGLGFEWSAPLPLVALLLSPVFIHRYFLWPGTSMQYVPTILFGFWAMRLLPQPTRRALVLAAICTVLAPYSHTHGLLVGWAGMAVLLWQRRFRDAGLYSISVVGVHVLYFIGYQSEFTPREFLGLNAYLERFLSACGSFFNFNLSVKTPRLAGLSLVVGALTVLIFLIFAFRFLWRGPARTNARYSAQLTLLGMGAWLLFALAAIGVSRAVGLGYFYNSRYFTVSIPFAANAYISALVLARAARRRWLILALSGILALHWFWHCYQSLYDVERTYAGQVAGVFNFQQFGRWEVYPGQDSTWERNIDSTTRLVLARKWYQLPETPLDACGTTLTAAAPSGITPTPVDVTTQAGGMQITNQSLLLDETERVFVRLTSPQRRYLLPVNRRAGGHLRYLTSGRRYAERGFHATVLPERYLQGVYVVDIVRQSGADCTVLPTPQRIRLGAPTR